MDARASGLVASMLGLETLPKGEACAAFALANPAPACDPGIVIGKPPGESLPPPVNADATPGAKPMGLAMAAKPGAGDGGMEMGALSPSSLGAKLLSVIAPLAALLRAIGTPV